MNQEKHIRKITYSNSTKGEPAMLIDRMKMLFFFNVTDVQRYYHFCHDILFCGTDSALRDIAFFCRESEPCIDFVCLKRYDDGEDRLFAYTDAYSLIEEALAYRETAPSVIDPQLSDVKRSCMLITDSEKVLAALGNSYTLTPSEDTASPCYYLRGTADLRLFPCAANTCIVRLDTNNIEMIRAQLAKNGETEEYSEDHIGLWALQQYQFSENYLLGIEESPEHVRWIGYLRAEQGYGNTADIGWVQIDAAERGHGYAKQLVSYFAADCLKNGKFPRYSFAVMHASEMVAEKCGFTRENGSRYRMMIEKRK
ncbi:MAG: GNAT family N-acetyltransferase [Clostridia bacterium]|nr:GNAT family N-acetyltransferase [Clostridia bacterium]